MQRITPFLWFDDNAEEAADFYTSVFKNSKITSITKYDKGSAAASGREEGSVMTVSFILDGLEFVALNGGPQFKFTEAISFVMNCRSQEEIDEYWSKLTDGGEEGPCGWLKDKFGLSWQIVPENIGKFFSDGDSQRSQRVTNELLKMKKLDIKKLQEAYEH